MSIDNSGRAAGNAPVGRGAPGGKKKSLIPAAVVLVAMLGAFVYLTFFKPEQGSIVNEQAGREEPAGEISGSEGRTLFSFDLAEPVFAEFAETGDTVTPKIPTGLPELSELANLKSFKEKAGIEFTQEQLEALAGQGFFLADNSLVGDQESGLDDFHDSYTAIMGNANEHYREPQNTVFITSDYALHLYHILVDRGFQRIEETKFQPMVRTIARAMFLDSLAGYGSSTDPKLKESYGRLAVFQLVPLVVLDAGSAAGGPDLDPADYRTYAEYLKAMEDQEIKDSKNKFVFELKDRNYEGHAIPDEIHALANEELKLIGEAKSIAPSPLFSPLRPEFKNDYSQFVPRSHYTKNAVLKSYFIAMMWYGRMGFPLNSRESTRDALILAGQLSSVESDGIKAGDLWSDLAAVIGFFVGENDDLTPAQYASLAKVVFAPAATDKNLADDAMLDSFIARAKKELPKPKILSEAISMQNVDEKTKEELLSDTMQLRFMGQRFTPDAYILNRLTQGDESPDPETGQKLPTMPTALMPLSVIAPDNQLVKSYLDGWVNDPARIAEQGRESDKIIAKRYGELVREFGQYPDSVWTSNIYWGWLDVYRPLLSAYGQGYPAFMQGEAWQKKNLGTVLGSYTELKHDTLLYAKQSYAELGGGGENPPLPPVVKGYVEPDLAFWNKILALAKKTKKGLEERGALPDQFEERYEVFINACEFLKKIVRAELQNEKIKDEDFEKLRVINSSLAIIVSPLNGQELAEKDRRAGIIADIHTDAVKMKILYEATGKPYVVYAVVKDVNGARLTRGLSYSHYEFTKKIDGRLTDEDWQARVYEGKGSLPAGDIWSKEIIR